MQSQKYTVNQYHIEDILTFIKTGEIAIPEIQRPFVWDATKVRDLMDSLYQGYPIGYLIAWRNPDVRLKDGRTADGKKILIDGQQRITALSAAILGQTVIDSEYRKIRIKIAFHPIEEKFEVLNSIIEKDSHWIPDIARLFSGELNMMQFVEQYAAQNQSVDKNLVFERLNLLQKIVVKQIGLIELSHDLDIETVTEIFIRINSKGVVLSQADFAMSKIASNETYNGSTLRKCIDYFCHLSVAPEFYNHIVEVDKEFVNTSYFKKMEWLKHENDDLYDPDYNDLLRVAFTSEFNRGKLADLVSLLSGRNFETRTFEDDIAKDSFARLEQGVLNFINENNFKKFVMIIKSGGFISPDLVRSQNSLNFAYILYLKLRALDYPQAEIGRYIIKWFVMSVLTGRYTGGAPESAFDLDIRNISTRNFKEYMADVEAAQLSDSFWNITLVQNLDTSVVSSPYYLVFLAAQVKSNDKGFLSRDITVNDMILHKGDIHHIFPKDYLKKFDYKRGQYNQVANYVYIQSEINIQIGNKAPKEYLAAVKGQCQGGPLKYGAIDKMNELQKNMKVHCIPESIFTMDVTNYDEFINERRKLMAQKMRDYYLSL
ncbi:MAG TPA: DUF262 domain-containing protein [Bacillota bacterium]|nr:DUF262 domain-containing protein [Bacillota bacterium]